MNKATHRSLLSIIFLALPLVTLSCSLNPKKDTPKVRPADATVLSESEARLRASQVGQVRYGLFIDLTSREKFRGKAQLQFDLAHRQRDLRIDLSQAEIIAVAVNGTPVPTRYNLSALLISKEHLRQGLNSIEVEYQRPYSRDGRGLHQFTDPEDKEAYVWTQFEPFYAHHLFPAFDQPDIKATYSLQVRAPAHWQVITSVRESQVTREETQTQLWTFPESARFSTYVFSLHAGPYTVWQANFRIPLRLMARKSLAKYVRPQDWFETTQIGLNFFESFFGIPYPYSKYDQVLTPEAGFGAMENVGAVTFNEFFIERGPSTPQSKRALINVIYHEMAHMWFGNLVTMRWWDDLWLNETFATFMASLASARDVRVGDSAWMDHFRAKAYAYQEDSYSTTHPVVVGKVAHTGEALMNFDAITYNKGAALIKQLYHWMGEDAFRAGLSHYFQKYRERNTTYKNFLSSLSQGSKMDVGKWGRDWFETSGYNKIKVDLTCKSDRIEQLSLTQVSGSGTPMLRTHTFEVGLYYRENLKFQLQKRRPVTLSGEQMVLTDLKGEPCPDVVFPNLGDLGYFLVELDPRSQSAIRGYAQSFEEPLLRIMLWQHLWDDVISGHTTPLAFVNLMVPESLAQEQDNNVLSHIITLLHRARPLGAMDFLRIPPSSVSSRELSRLEKAIDQILINRIRKSAKKSDSKMTLVNGLLALASSPEGMGQLRSWLQTGRVNSKLPLDQDRRWWAIGRIVHEQSADASKWVKGETMRDKSSRGVDTSIALNAALAPLSDKLKWIDEIKKEKTDYSLSQFRAVFANLFPLAQEELRAQYASQFFEDLKIIDGTKPETHAQALTALAPRGCTPEDGKSLDALMKTHIDAFRPLVRKALIKNHEDSVVCRRIMENKADRISD